MKKQEDMPQYLNRISKNVISPMALRLTQKKIDEVIVTILGEDGIKIVHELLKGKGKVSEFRLATALKKDIKKIRQMLYLLYNHNLVSFDRKKDKKKGWYNYYWTFLSENIKQLYLRSKKERLVRMKEELKKEESGQFFLCSKRCIKLDFDQAMDFEFKCPECGDLISQDVRKEVIIKLKTEIKEIENEVK